MGKNPVIGTCYICGRYGPLSKEHIPPQKAFNDRRVIRVNLDKAIELGPDIVPNGQVQQGGICGYTLCGKCNNETGSWYGSHFVDWSYQGMGYLSQTGGQPSLYCPFYVRPLPVIKQIIVMFFSVNQPPFAANHPELVKFVRDKKAKYLSPHYQLFVYYNIEGACRYTGFSVKGDTGKGKMIFLSEISFPPFGYVMTIDSISPDTRLYPISHFSHFEYDDHVDIHLKFPTLPTYLIFPGDYRSKEQIEQDYLKNIKHLA